MTAMTQNEAMYHDLWRESVKREEDWRSRYYALRRETAETTVARPTKARPTARWWFVFGACALNAALAWGYLQQAITTPSGWLAALGAVHGILLGVLLVAVWPPEGVTG